MIVCGEEILLKFCFVIKSRLPKRIGIEGINQGG
jgi:hypothetical protein